MNKSDIMFPTLIIIVSMKVLWTIKNKNSNTAWPELVYKE